MFDKDLFAAGLDSGPIRAIDRVERHRFLLLPLAIAIEPIFVRDTAIRHDLLGAMHRKRFAIRKNIAAIGKAKVAVGLDDDIALREGAERGVIMIADALARTVEEVDGLAWQQISTPAGNEGWVAADFIVYQ